MDRKSEIIENTMKEKDNYEKRNWLRVGSHTCISREVLKALLQGKCYASWDEEAGEAIYVVLEEDDKEMELWYIYINATDKGNRLALDFYGDEVECPPDYIEKGFISQEEATVRLHKLSEILNIPIYDIYEIPKEETY